MKKALTLLCVLFSLSTHAQFNKGDKFIGGSVSFSKSQLHDTDDYTNKNSNVGFSPSFGYALTKNFFIGGSLGIGHTEYTSVYFSNAYPNSIYSYKNDFLKTSVFVTRFFSISEKFFFSLKGDIDYTRYTNSSTHTSSTSTTDKLKTHAISASVIPSLVFFPSQRWGLEASLGGITYGYKHGLGNDYISRGFNSTLGSLNLGVAYYFRK
jgi:hypothetical protein